MFKIVPGVGHFPLSGTIVTNQIKCPGMFPRGGGGGVTPGIDSCIALYYNNNINSMTLVVGYSILCYAYMQNIQYEDFSEQSTFYIINNS